MKYLIYFLFSSSAVFSQNYQYAIEESQSKELNVPTNLVASQITPVSVNLAWIAPTDETSISEYRIYNNGTLLATSTGISTTFALSGLTPETAYSLTLRAVDKSSKVSGDSNTQEFTTDKINTLVNNQLEEIEYFKAYFLPLAKKATLQQALDTYGSVRLDKGDYSGVNIVMKSNQKLYGYPGLKTRVSNITIAAGSSGVLLEELVPADKKIMLQPGAVISGCTLKSIKWATLEGINVMFENNTLINYQGNINLNCSISGYFRNNKIIRHQTGGFPGLVMKGNNTTPSYGNVTLWTNYLTPNGDPTDINGLQSATFVGLDAESWNYTNQGTKAMFYAQNMGNVKIADLNGGSSSAVKTPVFDIDATDLFLFNRVLADPTDVLSLRTNLSLLGGSSDIYTRKAGTVTGFDLLGNTGNNQAVKYNSAEQTSTIIAPATITKISNAIKGTQHKPWVRPTWNTVPDPLGASWATVRNGKPDSRAYIQNLINTNRIAELPKGIYYIGSTLLVPADGNHGIVGTGTGETVICGLTDNFPLISIKGGYGVDGNIVLSYLTLQGGNTGFYASTAYGGINIAYQSMKFIVFRNQVNAIHLDKTGGFDNNFLENTAFIDCNKGFYQQPTAGTVVTENNSAYVDKTTFYKSQFINCNTAISMRATRANNLNAWMDCKFDGGNVALDLANNNAPIIANCDFKGFTGNHVISTNSISIYNSNFYNNNVIASTIESINTNIEGCSFLDSSNMFVPVLYNPVNNSILNSTIAGNVMITIPPNQGFGPASAVYSNSNLIANPSLSKLLVNVKNGTPTVIIDATPTPYPQFLVTQ